LITVFTKFIALFFLRANLYFSRPSCNKLTPTSLYNIKLARLYQHVIYLNVGIMKRSIVVTGVCLALAFYACQENREDLRGPVAKRDFYKTVGEQIPFETGMEWIEYYKWTEYNKNAKLQPGRIQSPASYNVPAAELTRMLQSTADLIGVALHYAVDDLGDQHILLLPVDGSLTLWSSTSPRVILDANTGVEIPQDQASAWAQNYKDANPTAVWFHFFGRNVFDEMQTIPYFYSLNIEPATNVLDLTPQLLLIIWNEELNSGGRTNNMYATVYDASNACPPCAVR
jgi:hypothetical protein